MVFERLPFPQEATAKEKLGLLMMGYRMTQLVYVAAELGIADRLADGPRSAEELAMLVGADSDHLFRVLRALASIGVFEQRRNGSFALNSLSELLCESVEGSVRDSAIRHGAEWSWLPWGALLHSVRTGEPAFDHALGLSHWEYMARHPRPRAAFGRSMVESTAWISSALVDAYDFPEQGTIVDVGGGHGTLLADILQAYPRAAGILLDRKEVVEMARETLSRCGVFDRCQLVPGDFFSGVPEGGNVYILKRIIHDWDDAHAIQILHNCRKAMVNNARMLIVERLLPEESIPSPVKIVDITVMVLYREARERTELEFQKLMAQAGLRLVKTHPLYVPDALIEAAGFSLLEVVSE